MANLKIVINNPKPNRPICTHKKISVYVTSFKGKVLGYQCETCLKTFRRHQVQLVADAFGYVDYYAISD
jgi:transposase-like protein